MSPPRPGAHTEIRIQQLVLHGLESYDPALIRRAVESELTRLVSRHGVAASPGQRQTVSARPVQVDPAADTPARERDLGAAIARRIHEGLGW